MFICKCKYYVQLCQMAGSERSSTVVQRKPETNLSTVGLKVKLVLYIRSETITLGSGTLWERTVTLTILSSESKV